jgi:hypothetical protein
MLETLLSLTDISFKWLLLLLNFVTLLLLYLHKRWYPPTKQHHIALLIAHPDDECMFFRPTARNLGNGYYLHLVCMSGGDTEREKELQ